jgi:hypothetical protein
MRTRVIFVHPDAAVSIATTAAHERGVTGRISEKSAPLCISSIKSLDDDYKEFLTAHPSGGHRGDP